MARRTRAALACCGREGCYTTVCLHILEWLDLKQQAAQKPSASAAATKSGKPVPSAANQAAAADPACPRAHSTRVAGDADVMLNQSNISANNNKFYRMQLLQEGPSDHWLWTRWGRVGDKGQNQLQGPFDADTGLREFNKKFKYAFSHTAVDLVMGACPHLSGGCDVPVKLVLYPLNAVQTLTLFLALLSKPVVFSTLDLHAAH